MRLLCLIVLFGIIFNPGRGQSNDSLTLNLNIYHQKGDYYLDRYEFKRTIVFYNRAYKKDASDYYAILKKAEAYSRLNLTIQAEECYRIVLESNQEVENEYLLKYALALLVNKKYAKSRIWLDKYNQSVEDDIRGENYISSIENQNKLYKDSTIQIIENLNELNTKESEINPVPYQDQIIFASSRTNAFDAISNGYYDILSANYSPSGEFIKITSFNNSINSSFHEGPLAISGDQSLLFFTQNITEKDSRNKVKLGIYKTSMPQEINDRLSLTAIYIDNFKYSIGHPTVNYDGTVMYFISNSTDGIGGLDIYKSKFTDEKWTYPENLGNVINTKGDEMFPFIYDDTVLYFASDGHGGLGGLDIYKVNLIKEPLQLINLGYPINSRFDDFSIFPQTDGNTGYFCSNRHGGVGSDDIYKFDILNFKVKGSILDAKNKAILEDAKITVLMSNGEEYLVSKTENGDFEFSIIPGQSYTLIIEKEDYKAEEIYLNEDVTLELRKQMMIELEPLQKTEIKLEAGQKYNFASGNDSLDPEYNIDLDQIVSDFKGRKDSTSDINVLDKQMTFSEGGVYSMQLIKDPGIINPAIGAPKTLLFINADTLSVTDDSMLVSLPGENETFFKLQTDLEHLSNNFAPENYSLFIDKSLILTEEAIVLSAEEEQALKELEWLMSLSINTTDTEEEDSTIQTITADGFSIIPRPGYTLKVGRKSRGGIIKEELEIPLTGGVKYNFSSNPYATLNYRGKLDALLEDRKGIEVNRDRAIDISLLSKELKIEEGEEFSFSLLPNSSIVDAKVVDHGINSTIFLNNRSFEITSDEKFQINVPYTPDRKVNINTDIEYLQENFEANEYSLDMDTIPFFSEILVDTTGYYKRFAGDKIMTLTAEEEQTLKELEWLMNLSINTTVKEEEDPTIQSITSDGFSIIPRSGYTLKVGKKNASGDIKDELVIPLTGGVKYDFSSNPDALSANRAKLDDLIVSRIDVDVKAELAIDISMLSKELEIKKGEEFSFSLLPDSASLDADTLSDTITSTILLSDRTFEITSNEKFQINVPYTPDRNMNINTNIEYLQDNFEADEYWLDIDTIPFFSEILIDTTGLYKRYQDPAFEKLDHQIISSIDNEETDSDIIYRLQIIASRKPVPDKTLMKKYTGDLEIRKFEEDGWYKYYIAEAPTYFEAKQVLNECGVKGAFIIAYDEGIKVPLKDAMSKQYKERMAKNGQAVGDSILNIVTVNFEFDKFSLRPDEANYLQELVIKKMKEIDKAYATVNGHTDIRGSDFYNIGLANERAKYVKSLMIKAGIDENRIKSFSFGESQVLKACEIPDNCDESVHQVNRRVEIVLFLPLD